MKALIVLVFYPALVGFVSFEMAWTMATGHPWPRRAKHQKHNDVRGVIEVPIVETAGEKLPAPVAPRPAQWAERWLVSAATVHLPKDGSDTVSLCGLTFMRPGHPNSWRDTNPAMCSQCTWIRRGM